MDGATFITQEEEEHDEQHQPQSAAVPSIADVMGMLDYSSLTHIQNDFLANEKRGEEMNMSRFVATLLPHIHGDASSRSAIVSGLCDLFAQIDLDGDGNLRWAEFTSFIVDNGMSSADYQPNAIKQYIPSKWQDNNRQATGIEKIYYFSEIDRIACCIEASPKLKLYTMAQGSDAIVLETVIQADGVVMCATHVPKLKQYVLATSNLKICFYDDTNFRRQNHTIKSATSQRCMAWSEGTLFTAGASGIIYGFRNTHKCQYPSIELRGHTDMVLDLLELPSLELLASASMDW
jgi:WD40 repeat protein